MAYTIKPIDATDQFTWLSSLKAILDELDVDYFDSTVLTVDQESTPVINELDFKKGDRVVCQISIPQALTGSGNKVMLYALGASAEQNLSALNTTPNVIITDYSVTIMWSTRAIMFTKTQTGKNTVITYGLGSTTMPAMTYEDNVVPTYFKYENRLAPLTQILPLLLGSYEGEYTPHICFAVRTQTTENANIKQITLNDKKFLTNGSLCLEFD